MKKSARLVIAVCVLSSLGLSQEKVSLTPEMAQNLRAMNSIMLHLLVDENYKSIAVDCDEIALHAKEIMDKAPVNDVEAVVTFKSYALQLDANAEILKVLAQKIQVGVDKKIGNTEVLKKSAALIYGQIVTSCVSCHQEFRIK